MAERGIDKQEEKKSYGSVFLIGIALLVVLTGWSFWDDNITRRLWKGLQIRFYRLDYSKGKAAHDEANKKQQAQGPLGQRKQETASRRRLPRTFQEAGRRASEFKRRCVGPKARVAGKTGNRGHGSL